MRVIGTAGHVDHGKSTLITALTGIDPDRLREERERGMTIDLGFAWLTLPGGEEVGIVDGPGHQDFIRNMLAGVGSIDAVPLGVALDESVRGRGYGSEAIRLGCASWHPCQDLVTARRLARAHAAGLRVHAWTVDDPARARRLVRLGVDGLFTNDPARLARALR